MSNPTDDRILGRVPFVDGVTRDVYEDEFGCQWVTGYDGERVYGVWLAPPDQPLVVNEATGWTNGTTRGRAPVGDTRRHPPGLRAAPRAPAARAGAVSARTARRNGPSWGLPADRGRPLARRPGPQRRP
jgi:hypothetical protein